MLLLLVFLGAARVREPRIVEMDNRRFKKSVMKRQMGDVWVVLFTSKDIAGHTAARAVLDESFALARGFIKFAHLDTSKNPYTPNKLNLEQFPCFCTFHFRGYECRNASDLSARAVVNWASENLIDYSDLADAQWLRRYAQEPVAVLFTTKPETPPVWLAVSGALQKSQLHIGISHDAELAAREFGIRDFPAIALRNFTHKLVYSGPNDFESITGSLRLFQKRRYVTPGTRALIHSAARFDELCRAGTICVLRAADSVGEALESLRQRHTTAMLQFFFGSALPQPLRGLPQTEFYVFSPSHSSYIAAADAQQLEDTVTAVLAQEAQWTPLPAQKSSEEL